MPKGRLLSNSGQFGFQGWKVWNRGFSPYQAQAVPVSSVALAARRQVGPNLQAGLWDRLPTADYRAVCRAKAADKSHQGISLRRPWVPRGQPGHTRQAGTPSEKADEAAGGCGQDGGTQP